MSKQVLLYHYATQGFDQLKTREAQGITEQVDSKWGADYNKHISLFIEPVPLDIMGRVYGKGHHVWTSGTVLFEHVVDLAKAGPFRYAFVETPEKTALLYDDSVDDAEFYRRRDISDKKNQYVGNTLASFMAPYKRLLGKTKYHILRADSFPNWEENRLKYAACVPHVMIYPVGGVMAVERCTRVVVK